MSQANEYLYIHSSSIIWDLNKNIYRPYLQPFQYKVLRDETLSPCLWQFMVGLFAACHRWIALLPHPLSIKSLVHVSLLCLYVLMGLRRTGSSVSSFSWTRTDCHKNVSKIFFKFANDIEECPIKSCKSHENVLFPFITSKITGVRNLNLHPTSWCYWIVYIFYMEQLVRYTICAVFCIYTMYIQDEKLAKINY